MAVLPRGSRRPKYGRKGMARPNMILRQIGSRQDVRCASGRMAHLLPRPPLEKWMLGGSVESQVMHRLGERASERTRTLGARIWMRLFEPSWCGRGRMAHLAPCESSWWVSCPLLPWQWGMGGHPVHHPWERWGWTGCSPQSPWRRGECGHAPGEEGRKHGLTWAHVVERGDGRDHADPHESKPRRKTEEWNPPYASNRHVQHSRKKRKQERTDPRRNLRGVKMEEKGRENPGAGRKRKEPRPSHLYTNTHRTHPPEEREATPQEISRAKPNRSVDPARRCT